MLKKKYDALVIGSGLSGLISGALLAKKGLDILVVNQEQMPWSYASKGFSIPRESFTGHGLKRYLFELIFEELELKSQERAYFERTRPVFQVVSPRFRMDVHGEREPLLAQYRRDFPKHIDAIARFYETLDSLGAAEKEEALQKDLKSALHLQKYARLLSPENETATLGKLFDQLALPPEFRQLILAQIAFLTHIHTNDPSLALAARVLATGPQKDFYFVAESRDLASIFYDRILSFGGAIRDEARVERLFVNGKALSEARLNTYEGIVHANAFIGNVERHRMFELIDPKQIPGRLQRKLPQMRPRLAQCVFYVGVRTEVLPAGMKSSVVLIGDTSRPLTDDNLVFIRVMPQPDSPLKSLLQISFFLPYPESQVHQAAFRKFVVLFNRTNEKIMEKLRWLIPYLDQHLLMSLPDANEHKTVHLAPRGYYSAEMDNFGKGLQQKSVYPNLFFTGREVFPGLGFEGETLSSLNAANLVYRSCR